MRKDLRHMPCKSSSPHGLQSSRFCLSCTFTALRALLGERLQGGTQEAIAAGPPTQHLHSSLTWDPVSLLFSGG